MTKKINEEIRLFSGDSGIPVELCHSKISKPSSNKFGFIPKNFPQLNKHVIAMNWNSSKKTISVEIEETVDFDVIRWIEYLVNEYLSSQKSPFVDVDTSSLQIIFQDIHSEPTGYLRLKNLKLEDHNVTLSKNEDYSEFGIDEETEPKMYHIMELSYQHSEFCKYSDRKDVPLNESESLEDWQKVEILPTN